MSRFFEGNLVLEKDSVFEESIEVEGDIVGKDGSCFDLTVKGNINAWNIKAGNIKARNIDYYAVCFAYQNIECKTIKGQRENAKHFTLDGKITTKQKPREGEK